MDSDALDHQVQLRALASALDRVCNVNCDMRASSPTVFDAVSIPGMTIHCYLVRLHRYTKFDFVCFHVAAWYLRRLCQAGPAYCPTLHNIHRLLVASLLVASKATDDIFHANQFMAQCGGIGVHELNKLEVDMCERLQWRLLPTVNDMRELLEAIPNPGAPFWNVWYNTPRAIAATPSTADAVPEQGEEVQPQQQQAQAQQQQPRSSNSGVAVVQMPRAKSVGESLARLFRGGASEGNLAAMAAASEAATAGPAGMTDHHAPHSKVAGTAATGVAALGEEMQSSLTVSGKHKDGSPRSVVSRTFSLSNLFGLASGW